MAPQGCEPGESHPRSHACDDCAEQQLDEE